MIPLNEAFDKALAHHQQGQLAEAEDIYRKIIEVEPTHASSLYFLGRIEHQKSRYSQAAQLIRQAIAIEPTDAAFHQHLGEALRAQNDFGSAIVSYGESIRLNPEYAPVYMSLADAFVSMGKPGEAETAYRTALRIKPDFAEAHNNLGVLLKQQQRLAEARACFEEALRLNPNFTEAHNNLGNVLRGLGLFEEALASYRRALQSNPRYGLAYFNLGGILSQLSRPAEAVVALREAIRLQPRDAEAIANLAAVLIDMENMEEAIRNCYLALEINPACSVAQGNLGVCLQSRGQLDGAIEAYRTAIQLDPENARCHSNFLYLLNYHPAYDAATIFSEHRAWAQRHAEPLTVNAAPHTNRRAPRRRLRLGYVSPHFRTHAVNTFFEPILASHHHESFEVFCYSDVTPNQRDQATTRLQKHADQWRETFNQNNQQLAETIRRDQIDILVDLTGHILGGKRLLAFARKPAPVQVTYLGYQNTTGMTAIDYRLTDAFADPPGETDAYYTEKLVRLPRCFFCYLPASNAPAVSPLPALKNGHVTFGSFNNFAKVTPEAVTTWAQILRAVPQSRLILLVQETDALRQQVREVFEGQGVSADRVELTHRRPHDQYLQLITSVDIAFDPFPFNGHTTTCDCLWLGVPVVMLAGKMYASRFGGSALVNLGLQDLIASNPAEYISIATRLAGDVERLKKLRSELRSMISDSPLLDAQGFTQNLEIAYRQMWERWCEKAG